MEYIIVKFDDVKQRATVSLRANELLPQLQEKEQADPESKYAFKISFISNLEVYYLIYICNLTNT